MSRGDDIDRNHDDTPDSPEVRSALAALRALPRPEPRDEARARARAAFVAGVADADAPSAGEVPPTRARVIPPDPERARRGRRPASGWALPLAAILAAVIVAVGFYGTRPPDQWRVVAVVAPEGVDVDADLALGAVVASGTVSTAAGSELELQLGTQLRFRLQPGTSLELPPPPGRWLGRSRELQLTAGEIYGTTADARLDFALHFVTPELSAQLVGTTFAVFRTAEGSCVCLYDGAIAVLPQGAPAAVRLPVEHRLFVFKDGRQDLAPIDARERMKLTMMHGGGMPAVPEE